MFLWPFAATFIKMYTRVSCCFVVLRHDATALRRGEAELINGPCQEFLMSTFKGSMVRYSEVTGGDRTRIAAAAAVVASMLAVAGSTGMVQASGAYVANPISVTGFNQDSIVENTYTISTSNGGYIPSNYAIPFDSGTGYAGNVLYESGLGGSPSGSGQPTGLPSNNQLVGAAFNSELNVTFQLQNYTNTNNVLNLTTTSNELGVSNGSTGTLTLASAGSYQGLAILAMGARGGGTGQVTLNFTDGTSVTTDYAAEDWYSGNTNMFTPDGNAFAYAATNVGRIATQSSNFSGGNNLDETILNLADLSNGTTTGNYSGEKIASLTFQQAGGSLPGGSSNIFAVSGFTQALPSAAPLAPVAVTGFNQNGIVPNSYTVTSGAAIPSNVAQPINGPGADNYALFTTANGGGLPANGQIVSSFAGASAISGPTTFQLQPYTGNSVLNLNNSAGTGTGTLTLANPGKFSQLGILAVRDDGGATESVTLTFADGSTVTTDFEALDWYGPGIGTTPDGNNYGIAASGVGRISTTNSGGNGGVDLYETVLNLTNLSNGTTFGNYSGDTLVSLTFSDSSTSGATDILAISGSAVPEPASLGLLACAGGMLLLLRRRNARV